MSASHPFHQPPTNISKYIYAYKTSRRLAARYVAVDYIWHISTRTRLAVIDYIQHISQPAKYTPGLHNKISAQNIFARGWVAQKSILYTINAKIFQGLDPKKRESSNGDRVYLRTEDEPRCCDSAAARLPHAACIYVYVCVYIYIYIQREREILCMYIYIYICIHTCTYIYIYMYIQPYKDIYISLAQCHIRPISVLRFWVSGGLARAES